jgi:hypothetical protein
MSPIGQLMSDWLQSKPGLFRGDSAEAVLKLAYANSPFPKRHPLSFDDFCAALDRVGYRPVERRTGWQLALPEGSY